MTASPALHILIVDDNAICAQLLAHIFTSKQLKGIATYEITIIHSAEEALCILKETCYDIIFTDIEMTNMWGDKMAQIIRGKLTGNIHEENRNIPIIAITSKYDSNSLKWYKEAGITRCLEKPAKTGSICKIIEDIAK